MSIINENAQASNQNQQRAQHQQPGQAAVSDTSSFSFQDAELFGSPLSRNVGSEYFNKFKEELLEIFKHVNPDVTVTLLDLDRSKDPDLDFSSIIVATQLVNSPVKDVAWHLLQLQPTGDEIPVITEQYNNTQFQITRTPGDAVNDVLIAKAAKELERRFPNVTRRYCDSEVVGHRLNLEDKSHMQRVAYSAVYAGYMELRQRAPGFKDYNLHNLKRDSNLRINLTFQRGTRYDAVNNPYRSDVQISLHSRRQGQNDARTKLNTGNQERTLSEISGFMDVLWAPTFQQGGMWAQNQPTQCYAARLVVTSLETSQVTNSLLMMAISTLISLSQNFNWVQGYRPVMDTKGVLDMTDIGYLNIEANLPMRDANGVPVISPTNIGKPVDTKDRTFTQANFYDYAMALFHKSLVVAIDVPEAGPQTWYLSILTAAAEGRTEPLNRILKALNDLTNGNFGQLFPAGSPLFAARPERIHLGYWIDNNGVYRDIREIDHIAIAALVGEKSPNLIREWSDTFLRLEFPEEQRLAGRLNLIQLATNNTAVVTGYARRLTFSGVVMETLSRAMAALNLPIGVQTPVNGSDFNNQRGTAQYVNTAMINNAAPFAGGYQNPNAGYTGYGGFRY